MGVSRSIISNLSKDKYTLKAKSTTNISFMGADPNYYRITNGGKKDLYLGVSMMPTENFFDQRIPAGTTNLFVDAYGHEVIHIYNPSEYDANIVITSFSADFDPSVLALCGMGQDLTNIQLSGKFDATGDLSTNISQMKKEVYLCRNKLDEISPIMSDNNVLLNTISQDTEAIKINTNKKCTKFYVEENTDAENMYAFSYINMLSNDSNNDMTFVLAGSRFVLKAHEVLTDMVFDAVKTIKIPKNSSYRIIGG